MKVGFLIEPPFNLRTQDGRVTGHDIEIVRHVADALGLGLVEPVETQFADLLPGLSDGRWRLTVGMFRTTARSREACFSRPIWALPDGLLQQADADWGGYRAIAEAGARLAAVRGQVQLDRALAHGVSRDRIVVFDTYVAAANAVRAGKVAAFASVAKAHDGYIGDASDVVQRQVPLAEATPMPGCLAFAQLDGALRDAVDAELARYLGSDAYQQMATRYGFDAQAIALVT